VSWLPLYQKCTAKAKAPHAFAATAACSPWPIQLPQLHNDLFDIDMLHIISKTMQLTKLCGMLDRH
jgi:hypothetical protein